MASPCPGLTGAPAWRRWWSRIKRTFDLVGLRAYLAEKLPPYARPLFLRFRPALEITGTFKQKKVELVEEGYDPGRTADPLFFDDRRSAVYVGSARILPGGSPRGNSRFERGACLRLGRGVRGRTFRHGVARSCGARRAEPFADPDFLLPAFQFLRRKSLRFVAIWSDARREQLIGCRGDQARSFARQPGAGLDARTGRAAGDPS